MCRHRQEKHYYLEATRDSVKDFLRCRTIGVPIAHSRLLGFHVVRSTRPCILANTSFVPDKQFCMVRDAGHKAKWPDYPHPELYLTKTQQYFFRNKSLLGLRTGLSYPRCVNYFLQALAL